MRLNAASRGSSKEVLGYVARVAVAALWHFEAIRHLVEKADRFESP